MKFCKEILIFSLLLILSATTGTTQNCTYSSGWFKVYAHLYNFSEEFEVQMTEPSLLLPQIRYEAKTTNRAQLVLIRNPYITSRDAKEQNIYKYGMNFYIPSRTLFNSRDEVTFSYADFPSINNINQLRINTKTPTDKTLTEKITAVLVYVDGVLISENMLEKKEFTVTYYQLLHSEIEVKILFENGTYKCIIPWIDGCEPFEDVEPDFTCSPPCPPPPPTPDDEDPPLVDNPPSVDNDCNIAPSYESEVTATIPFNINAPGVDFITTQADHEKFSSGLNPAITSTISDDSNVNDDRFGKLTKTVYLNPNHSDLRKPIILCDGIDFFSNRVASEILIGTNHGSALMQQLFDGGYDIVIADFDGGADFIQQNAFALIELIREINKDEELTIEAVIGPSMGGQVVRYALLHWENNLLEQYGEYDIKLFVSADSPWLGANVAPSIQSLAGALKNNPDFGEDLGPMDALINSPATRQLLIHHQLGLNFLGKAFCHLTPINQFEYRGMSHPYKIRFDRELAEMGDFPKGFGQEGLTIIATADGALTDGNWQAYLDDPNINLTTPYESLLVVEKTEDIGIAAFTGVITLWTSMHQSTPRTIVKIDGAGLTPICDVKEKLNLEDIRMESALFHHLDSAPGSPFDLKESVKNISGVVSVGSFAFIPTFSALGINLDDPYKKTDGVPTPFFTDTYADFTNSKHVDFTQEGTLEFIIGYLDFEEGNYTECDYLDDLAETGVVGNSISIDIPYENQNTWTWFEGAESNTLCFANAELLGDDGLEDLTITSMNVLTDCGLPFEVVRNEFTIPEPSVSFQVVMNGFDSQDAGPLWNCHSIQVEICYEHSLCLTFEECEIINVDVDFVNTGGGFIGQNEEDETINTKDILSSINTEFNKIEKDFSVYPNPTTGLLNVRITEPGMAEVYDINGKIIFRKQLNNWMSQLEIDAVPGMYILRYTSDSGELYPATKLFIE